MHSLQRHVWAWRLAAVALFCVPLFVGLGRTDLGNDEAIYSFAVDKILETGDWLTPRTSPRVDIAFLEKPPLKFWIVAAPIRFGLLPQNEFGLRFWDAVMGAVAFLYVFAFGRRLAGPVCGFISVLLLFVHAPLLFDHGLRSNNMEGPLVLAYCGGLYHYLAWTTAGSRRRANAHVAGVMAYFVLGFMTKFVAALFLPVVLLVAALAVGDDRRRLRRDRWVWSAAALVAVLLIVPWFVYQWRQFGSDVWKIMMGAHVYTRFTRSLDPSHLQPWHFYVSALYVELRTAQSLALTIPGAVLLTGRAIAARRREDLLVLAWFVVPVTLISLGSSKLYHYLYPFLPPVALAGGYFAALVLDVVPRYLRKHADAFDEALPGRVGRRAAWLSRPGVRAVLLVLAAAAVAIAVWTLVRGGVDLKVGGTRLLRNASSTRPLLYAVVFAALAGRMRLASMVAAPLLVLYLSPLVPYGTTWSSLQRTKDPMRTARNCLLTLNASGTAVPGVYVDVPPERVHHFHHYYLEPVGRWERPDESSDRELFARLFVESKQKPILVWEERYQKFVSRLQHRDARLFDEIERTEGLPRATIEYMAEHASWPMVPLDEVLLVLPGRFSACGR